MIADAISALFSYTFMLRALIVGVLVSVCASLLGVSLVLKRFSMIGDGLSHVGFGALAIAAALNMAPLKLAVPVVIVAAFLLLKINEKSRLGGDAAIALISTSALAIGVVAVSVSGGVNIDVSNYMFGSILGLSESDMWLSIVLAAIVIPLFVIMYNRIFAVTFDETFAVSTGINANLYNIIIAVLTAFTIVLGMRLMGTLLISGLIIFPSITSMRVFRSFKGVVISSAVIPVISFTVGLAASFALSSPPGASVVVVNMLMFLLFRLYEMISGSVKTRKKAQGGR